MGFYVAQLDIVTDLVGLVFIFIKHKINDSHAIDLLKLKIPLAAFNSLVPDRESGIIQSSFLEIFLLSFLKFNDEFFALFIGAV